MSLSIPRPGERRTDLDLLRIVACFAIIVAHAVLIFTAEPRYHVKSATAHLAADILYEALRIGTLPLFFALAGWSSVAALRRRPPGRFMRDRAMRVLLPLAAGILLIGPFIKFIERGQGRNLGTGGFRMVEPLQLGFWEFLPLYWSRLNLLTWSHLWFLGYLFLISLALLPLLAALARRTPSIAIPGRALALAPAAGLAAVAAAFDAYWPNLPNLVQDLGSLVFYAGCVALGALLAAWPGLEARLRGDAPWFLALAALGFGIMIAAGHGTLGRIGVGLCAWGAIGACFGYAGRCAPAPNAALGWLGDATMAVYVLHHVPLLALAAWLLPLGLPDAVSCLLIIAGATAASLLAYRYLVQPWPAPRILLGMDARPRPAKVT
jgi:glucans biosynthesis protein C